MLRVKDQPTRSIVVAIAGPVMQNFHHFTGSRRHAMSERGHACHLSVEQIGYRQVDLNDMAHDRLKILFCRTGKCGGRINDCAGDCCTYLTVCKDLLLSIHNSEDKFLVNVVLRWRNSDTS